MRFSRTPQFKDDYEGLTEVEKLDVENAFGKIALALQGNNEYFRLYRIKKMEGWPGIWEGHIKDNLCFVFHYKVTDDGEKTCWFRRVGKHNIYRRP